VSTSAALVAVIEQVPVPLVIVIWEPLDVLLHAPLTLNVTAPGPAAARGADDEGGAVHGAGRAPVTVSVAWAAVVAIRNTTSSGLATDALVRPR
jgi:hypothetical protein